MKLALSAKGISKNFGDKWALKNVSLNFAQGKIHAVLGENGAGKSTLMKIIFGLYDSSSGSVEFNGELAPWRNAREAINCGVGMVQQHFCLVDTLSAIDNIILGAEGTFSLSPIDREKSIKALEEMIPSKFFMLPWKKEVGELSVGERQKIEILKLLFRRAQILILDEPTAVLTPLEIEEFFKVLRSLREQGKTILLITHKIREVMELCDTYSILRQGQVTGHGQVSEISESALVEMMIGRKLTPVSVKPRPTQSQTVLSVQNLKCRAGHRGGVKNVSMELRQSEVVGIAGVEGSGQSTLVDCILGLVSHDGQVKWNDHLDLNPEQVRAQGVALVPEDRHHQGLWLKGSALENAWAGLEHHFSRWGFLKRNEANSEALTWMKHFDVRTLDLRGPVSGLSGGNQQKLIFARELEGRQPRALICHQPTRGVDLGAIQMIHEKILEMSHRGLAVLVISSELDELFALCDRIYVMYEGQINKTFQRQEFDRFKVGQAMTGISA